MGVVQMIVYTITLTLAGLYSISAIAYVGHKGMKGVRLPKLPAWKVGDESLLTVLAWSTFGGYLLQAILWGKPEGLDWAWVLVNPGMLVLLFYFGASGGNQLYRWYRWLHRFDWSGLVKLEKRMILRLIANIRPQHMVGWMQARRVERQFQYRQLLQGDGVLMFKIRVPLQLLSYTAVILNFGERLLEAATRTIVWFQALLF